jgi:hypothetical protein
MPLGRDAEGLRQSLELTDRWSQVVVELDKLRHGVVGAMNVRRHRVGATALQAYQLSQQLARYRENNMQGRLVAARKKQMENGTLSRAGMP